MNIFKKKIPANIITYILLAIIAVIVIYNYGKLFREYTKASKQNIAILTQSSFTADRHADIQIFAKDIKGKDIEKAKVEISLGGEKFSTSTIYKGELRNGALNAGFAFPKIPTDRYRLMVNVRSDRGEDVVIKDVDVNTKHAKIIIEADRLLYKPGQRADFRSLVLDKQTMKPIANSEVRMSIVDPKKNKIYQRTLKTSAHGIVSDHFLFAEQTTNGGYALEAETGGETASLQFDVKEYVLPKFELKITSDQDLALPQNNISGKVKASYFFGKPVSKAHVEVKLEAGGYTNTYQGSTDENGFMNYSFSLPNAGPVANIILSAIATDLNNNQAQADLVNEADSGPINIEIVPESEKVKPGLENNLYIFTSGPKGEPLSASVILSGDSIREITTDKYGFAKFTYRSGANDLYTVFNATVKDDIGNRVEKQIRLENEKNPKGYMLIHPQKTYLNNEKSLSVDLLSTNDKNATIEMIQNGDIVYSDTVEIKNGKASKTMELPEEMFGSIEIRATQVFSDYQDYYYTNAYNFRFVTDSKLVIVDQPRNLDIKIETDKETYEPGSEAKVKFVVNNGQGSPSSAALGVKVVDESLLSLKNDNAALSKLLFILDEKTRNNARSINGLSAEEAVNNNDDAARNNILSAMLSSVPPDPVALSKLEKNNHNAWSSLEARATNLIQRTFLAGLGILVVLLLVFYWKSIKLAAENKIGFNLFGLIILIGLCINLLNGIFELFDIYDMAQWMVEWANNIGPGFVIAIAISFVAIILLVRNRVKNDYQKYLVPMNILIISTGLILLPLLLATQMDIFSQNNGYGILANTTSGFVAEFIYLVIAFVIIAAILIKEKTGYSVIFWTLAGYAGIISSTIITLPVLAAVWVVIGAIHGVKGSKTDIVEEIEKRQAELIAQGKSKEAIELEMLLVSKEMRRNRLFSSLGRVASVLILICAFLFLLFFGFIVLKYRIGHVMYSSSPNFGYSEDIGFADPIGMSGGNDNFGSTLDLGTSYPSSIGLSAPAPSLPFAGLFKEAGGGSPMPDIARETEITVGQNPKAESFAEVKRVRRFFPETLYYQAELIAENGLAQIIMPIKDSITSWRMSALGNSITGDVGSASKRITTFQDFFVDLDVPNTLVEGDEIELPVSVFNYLSDPQKVSLEVISGPGISIVTPLPNTADIEGNNVNSYYLRLKAVKFGNYSLQIKARGQKMADAIEKDISVLPYGRAVNVTSAVQELNQDKFEFQVGFPASAIKGTSKIIAKIYPTVFSQVVDGMDKILRMPSGCFEQISSSLYPDILVLKYLDKTGKDNPEARKKAEEYIGVGMQKILTYESEPGGFSLYGQGSAETVLTAYGLMEFNELKDHAFVDDNLLKRMKEFLYNKQQPDGKFAQSGYHSGGLSRVTDYSRNAYIAWALSEAEGSEARLKKTSDYLKTNISEAENDNYVLALAANVFVNIEPSGDQAKKTLEKLKEKMNKSDNDKWFIEMNSANYYGSYGRTGNIEATALAAIAFTRSGQSETAQKLLGYLTSSRDGQGTWFSTQSTVLTLKALIENEIKSKAVDTNIGKIGLDLNGSNIRTIDINKDNSELYQNFEMVDGLKDQNTISLAREGDIRATFHLVKSYYGKMDNAAVTNDGLSITAYPVANGSPRQEFINAPIAMGQKLSVDVDYSSNRQMENAIIEIPLPAGLSVDEDLLNCQLALNKKPCTAQNFPFSKALNNYEIRKDRLIIYINQIQPGAAATLKLSFIAKYRGKYYLLPARLYGYYNPEREAYSNVLGYININ
jgi:hypothetical protein